MAASTLAILGVLGAALLPCAAGASAPAMPLGGHSSVLQTALRVGKAPAAGKEPPRPACRTAAEEAALQRSLQLRLRHLERATVAQRKKLDSLSLELTGEPSQPSAGAAESTGAAAAARVLALERGLQDRAIVTDELLKGTRAELERTRAELEGTDGQCDAACVCSGEGQG
mmetsp:Transcript_56801/g.157223  ORF Transcript_56801/g.157223 Transcript_56801/m.157223 type:complete len:171 (+) Transcript_56801:125-637(+)